MPGETFRPTHASNPDRDLLEALERILFHSRAMLGAARQDDWEAVTEHEGQRRQIVTTLPADFGKLMSVEAQGLARQRIEQCLFCDQQIHPLAQARLDELRVVLRAVPDLHSPAP